MSFSDIFIRRPVLSTVLACMILLLGFQGIFNLSIRQYPKVDETAIQRRLGSTTIAADYGVRVIFEILEVLHKVHQIGIIHRDINPRNISLARRALFGEIPKLLDFGVAHFANRPNTQPGGGLGSPF